jgi:hypothetical protein
LVVTGTPARDALRHLLVDYYANADLLDHEVIDLTVEALLCPEEHPTVIAALVESGWKPTADDLRAMGGIEARVSGASSVPVEDDHPIEWLRGRTTVELAFAKFPSPVRMSAECIYFPEGVDGD